MVQLQSPVADYTKDLRLEHCVECPATNAWNYDTSFCGQFLDEQGTDNYRRYSTIANLKPIEGFVTPSDLEARVAAIETTLDGLLSKIFRVDIGHAEHLMAQYTTQYKTLLKAGEPNLNLINHTMNPKPNLDQ